MAHSQSRSLFTLVKEAFSEWKEDNASRLAAALAYYTTFSIAPLLLLIITIAGLLVGQTVIHDQIMTQIEGLVGPQGRAFIEDMLISASQPRNGLLASAVGIIILLFGALGVFAELQNSLNTIWEVKPKPIKNMKQNVWHFLKQRILSFSMVLAIGFVLVASLAVSAALSAFGNLISNTSGSTVWVSQAINLSISFIVITILFGLMFKFLPDAEIAWRDVWLGAAVTSLLFNLGKFAIGFYLGYSTVGSTFGAAGSLVLILIWVYYSAQIFFFGAEVTQVYANEFGSHIIPDEDAVKVTEQARAEQGIPHQGEIEQEAVIEHEYKIRCINIEGFSLEADFLGLCFMDDAGYDPKEMAALMGVLEQADQGQALPEFFSTHPNPGRRIELIQRGIQNLDQCPGRNPPADSAGT